MVEALKVIRVGLCGDEGWNFHSLKIILHFVEHFAKILLEKMFQSNPKNLPHAVKQGRGPTNFLTTFVQPAPHNRGVPITSPTTPPKFFWPRSRGPASNLAKF